jgi:hypothetical protein
MKQIVIVFVPTDVTQNDFESALRKNFKQFEYAEVPPHRKASQTEPRDADELPLWRWFISEK